LLGDPVKSNQGVIQKMISLFVIIFVSGYAMAASWAAPQGLGRLWLTAFVALLLIVGGIGFWGNYKSLPNLPRIMLYFGSLTGPTVIIPTVMLSRSLSSRSTFTKALPTAFLGACLGFACGFVIVIYGYGVW
jgi:hypothetical protein